MGLIILVVAVVMHSQSAYAQFELHLYAQRSLEPTAQALAERCNQTQDRVTVRVYSAPQSLPSNVLDYDLLVVPEIFLPELVATGQVLDLGLYAERDPLRLGFNRSVIDQTMQMGRFSYVPFQQYLFLVFAHQRMLDESGLAFLIDNWTWEEYLHWILKLARPGQDRYGAVLMPWNAWAFPFLQMGGDLVYGPYDGVEIGLQFVRDVVAHNKLTQPVGSFFREFESGKSATVVATPNHWTNGSIHNLADMGWALLPLPAPENHVIRSLGNASLTGITVSAASAHPNEAWSFIQWVMSPEGSETFLQSGVIPLSVYPDNFETLSRLFGNQANHIFSGRLVNLLYPFYPSSDTYVAGLQLTASFLEGKESIEGFIEKLAEIMILYER